MSVELDGSSEMFWMILHLVDLRVQSRIELLKQGLLGSLNIGAKRRELTVRW